MKKKRVYSAEVNMQILLEGLPLSEWDFGEAYFLKHHIISKI